MSETYEEGFRQQTEEICGLCGPKRRKEGLEPNYLIRMGPTLYKDLEVLVCPTCDTGEENGA